MKILKSDLQLESVVRRIETGEIDLQPDFQRGEVWDAKRRQRLIDTILRNWYIPAIHIVIDNSGDEVVLDGQQRLEAIRKFFSGEVKIDGNIEPFDENISELHGATYRDIPPGIKKSVNRFVLQIITLTEYEPQEPNELFFRLNQSYNLTPPEKRNALHGEARDQVKELVKELTEIGLLEKSVIGFGNARLAYDDIVARTCVTFEFNSIQQHINNNVVEEFYRSRKFSQITIEEALAAGRVLLSQINYDDSRVRLNKGTLQTWLTYSYWTMKAGQTMPRDLFYRFEESRMAVRRGEYATHSGRERALEQILSLYDDRASYRVTDVSSVLIRDLMLHLYSQITFDTASCKGSSTLIEQIVVDPDSMKSLIDDFLRISEWGKYLVVGGLK